MAGFKIMDINEVEWKRDWPRGLSSCVMKMSPDATLQYWEIPPGGGADPHSHPEAQLSYVQTGVMKFTVDGEEHIVREGCFAYIPGGAVHASDNIGSSTVVNIDFFMPDRDDREESPKVRDISLEVK